MHIYTYIYFSVCRNLFILNTHFPSSLMALSLSSLDIVMVYCQVHVAPIKSIRFFILCNFFGCTGTGAGLIFGFIYGPNGCFLSVSIHFDCLGSSLYQLLSMWNVTPGLEVVGIESYFGSSLKISVSLPITLIH